MKNPGALETAVNRHHPDTIEEFADNFRRAGPAIARDARLMEMKAGHVETGCRNDRTNTRTHDPTARRPG